MGMHALKLFAFLLLATASLAAAPRPNILFILADDMGYGDPRCFNPKSKIPTPNIDKLAAEGLRFTDAHAPGAVCVPSRYGLLTGRYPFRNQGVNAPTKGALITPGQATIATVLKGAGYRTAMIGKWHEGFDGGDKFDYTKPLRGGPVDHGFDSFFGQHASLDIPPYFFIQNDRCVQPASGHIAAGSSPDWSPIQGAFWREGNIASDYKLPEVLSTYTHKAVEHLAQAGEAKEPFFLYLAFTAPHTPWLPGDEFHGRSQAGMYGDFVAQVDDSIGQVLTELDKAGLKDNTLVFFSSDNGPVWFPENEAKYGHSATAGLRGMKGDAWEGGHRMPFIARWPGKVRTGESKELIGFTDMMATFAAVSGAPAPVGTDSVNLLPELLGETHAGPVHETLIIESSRGVLTLRRGPWKLIPELGSCGFTKPSKVKPAPGGPTGQLYDLASDPGEQTNLWAKEPEKVKELTALLEKCRREP